MGRTVRKRGLHKGGIGYPGKKVCGSNTFPVDEDRWLRGEERRLGVSKSVILTFYVRRARLADRVTLEDIKRDIEAGGVDTTEQRRQRWAPTLAE